MTILKDDESRIVAQSVKPDAKNRVVLPKELIREGVTYHVYVNEHEQIILDPQITVPLSEMWIFENKEILSTIDKGMAESAQRQTVKRGSFAGYAQDEA